MHHTDCISTQENETLQVCLHYRELDKVIERDYRRIMRMKKCIKLLGKASSFSISDTMSKEWQIKFEDS